MSAAATAAGNPDVPIGVVWCDYGGVLTPPVSEAVARIEAASGLPWSELGPAFDRVAAGWGLRGLGPLERGLVSQFEWGRLVTAELPPDRQPAIDLSFFGDYWNAGRRPEVALLDELERIRGLGVRVGMLTNSVAEWEPYRRELLAGRQEFDAALRSHETGLVKPDEAIFARADELLPAHGRRVLLIDDVAVNCVAAEDHGWLSIQHRDAASTIAQLTRLFA